MISQLNMTAKLSTSPHTVKMNSLVLTLFVSFSGVSLISSIVLEFLLLPRNFLCMNYSCY